MKLQLLATLNKTVFTPRWKNLWLLDSRRFSAQMVNLLNCSTSFPKIKAIWKNKTITLKWFDVYKMPTDPNPVCKKKKIISSVNTVLKILSSLFKWEWWWDDGKNLFVLWDYCIKLSATAVLWTAASAGKPFVQVSAF